MSFFSSLLMLQVYVFVCMNVWGSMRQWLMWLRMEQLAAFWTSAQHLLAWGIFPQNAFLCSPRPDPAFCEFDLSTPNYSRHASMVLFYANGQKDICTHKHILSLDKISDQAKGLVWSAWHWEGWSQWLYFSVGEALWGCCKSYSLSFLLCMLYIHLLLLVFSQPVPGQVWKGFIYKITDTISKTLKETATNSNFIDPETKAKTSVMILQQAKMNKEDFLFACQIVPLFMISSFLIQKPKLVGLT